MASPPLSQVLPPLLLGTATFNHQYHPDPSRMPYVDIVRRALEHGITAFDTSPYYGPSEVLLGQALRLVTPPPPREGYFLVTKAGRIKADEFDYSPAWVRYSVCRSLERLGTPYLDLVYMHDVEFVSPAEVLQAVAELRRLRDQGLIRYVGISGYPVETLAALAETVLRETGEPLDADPVRFRAARVECLLNASILNMGLLTTRGVDNGPMASWHPSPPELRRACATLSQIAKDEGEHLEGVAIRWALENWARAGKDFGTTAYVGAGPRIGASVMGVTAVSELDETWDLWRSVIGPVIGTKDNAATERSDKIARLVRDKMWPSLGSWKDYAWESGGEAFVNARATPGQIPNDEVAERWGLVPSAAAAAVSKL
ncbi:Aldo/keto reductase [Trichoderma citrinoviride]|uniref:Aldo/keto reductase n=1 Tax=Trichoderma citrinoviride TaxID=58853 RepID=A0A2T4AZ35_9HYPO|nr:Aldo/keto reductase [Trichoderma citrinoviride]PTB62339.1 Aldo/keto reductase [Trichoderma citrinoviride]